ncbi:hypothetical protein DFH09DRAFT_1362693 [Mycena vulgaris]|nr:hypothetical protein DFH09DRAFT_1362693 [Mycena vulgaris]
MSPDPATPRHGNEGASTDVVRNETGTGPGHTTISAQQQALPCFRPSSRDVISGIAPHVTRRPAIPPPLASPPLRVEPRMAAPVVHTHALEPPSLVHPKCEETVDIGPYTAPTLVSLPRATAPVPKLTHLPPAYESKGQTQTPQVQDRSHPQARRVNLQHGDLSSNEDLGRKQERDGFSFARDRGMFGFHRARS